MPEERTDADAAPPRLDARAQHERLAAAFGRRRRSRALVALLIIALVWCLAAGYYKLTPPQYISRWSLILPAANSGSTVTLDTIGQASSVPAHTFGTLHLSPKVIYREIISSEQVRSAAAAGMRMTPAEFGRVRVRLVDETALINLQIPGRSPEEAQAKARAVLAAFNAQLDQLRRDEYEKRAGVMRESLKIYQVNLDRARERIVEFQRSTGFLSQNQFNEASSSAELIRRNLAGKRGDLEKMRTELDMLVKRVGFDPREAMAGLRLAANPAFSRVAAAYADAVGAVHENNLRYGPRHPAQVAARMKLEGSQAEIVKIAAEAQIDHTLDLGRLMLFLNVAGQTDILRSIVTLEAQVKGWSNEVSTLEAELKRVEGEVARMGLEAARLEALRKDHLVAEAVFSSAAARLDTNRTDIYASYPLAQVLSEPELPDVRTQPRLTYALAAGVFGTLLVLIGWGVAALAGRFKRRRQRRARKSLF